MDPFLAEEDRSVFYDSREPISAFVAEIPTFSHEGVRLTPWDEDVRQALLEEESPNREILADEWTFLSSHSWMAAKLHYALDKFRDAGAVVVTYGQRLRDEMIQAVVPSRNIPDALTPVFLAKVGVKWIVVGGPTAGSVFFPPAAFGSIAAVPIVRAFDP